MMFERVLVVSDAATPISTTGFSIPTRIIIDTLLGMGCRVTHLARGGKPDLIPPEWDSRVRVKIPHDNDFSGYQYIGILCEQEPFDCIIFEADPKSIEGWTQHASVRSIPIICHTAVEGAPLLGSPAAALCQILCLKGVVTAYTQFSAKTIEKAMQDTYASGSDEMDFTVPVISLGADHEDFKPADPDEREELRYQLGWKNRTIIMTNGRNAARKRLPTLIKAVKILNQEHPEIMLYLHTSPYEGYNLGGWHLKRVAQELGAIGCTIFTDSMNDGAHGITPEELIRRYQAADLYVNCSGCEGFGIPSLEAAKCGLPVFHPTYAGGWEVCQPFAIGLEPVTYETHSSGAEEAIVMPETIANAVLEYLSKDKEAKNQIVQKGIEEAGKYSWRTLSEAIPGLLGRVLR